MWCKTLSIVNVFTIITGLLCFAIETCLVSMNPTDRCRRIILINLIVVKFKHKCRVYACRLVVVRQFVNCKRFNDYKAGLSCFAIEMCYTPISLALPSLSTSCLSRPPIYFTLPSLSPSHLTRRPISLALLSLSPSHLSRPPICLTLPSASSCHLPRPLICLVAPSASISHLSRPPISLSLSSTRMLSPRVV